MSTMAAPATSRWALTESCVKVCTSRPAWWVTVWTGAQAGRAKRTRARRRAATRGGGERMASVVVSNGIPSLLSSPTPRRAATGGADGRECRGLARHFGVWVLVPESGPTKGLSLNLLKCFLNHGQVRFVRQNELLSGICRRRLGSL